MFFFSLLQFNQMSNIHSNLSWTANISGLSWVNLYNAEYNTLSKTNCFAAIRQSISQYEIGSNTKEMYYFKLLFIQSMLVIAGVVQAYDKFKVVETDNGAVRGVRNTTLLNGVLFYSFRGIPYAKAPIGDLRFKVKLNPFSSLSFF